ncbi:hypothetical protein GNF79_16465 [Clostridium perfringens]|uniref:beta-galactosidase n=1 Tax=Clostridium perfringens TaxID=1502 RepID=A0AAW9IFP6_CLOPF|nr:hypothetical protein [Clostridium perfringens]
MSVLPYTPHELENAYHAYELPPIYHTVLKISLKQSGVGGDDSWGAEVHDEYKLKAEEERILKFSIIGKDFL